MIRPLHGSPFWQRLKRDRLAVTGGIIVLCLFAVAILAPIVSPYKPNDIDRKNILISPSIHHPLGTDDLGRDVLSRMIWGARISLAVGFVAVGIATAIGIILGALAGYYGGWFERIIMRFIDIMLTLPTLFLILAVMAYVEPSIWNTRSISTWWSGPRVTSPMRSPSRRCGARAA